MVHNNDMVICNKLSNRKNNDVVQNICDKSIPDKIGWQVSRFFQHLVIYQLTSERQRFQYCPYNVCFCGFRFQTNEASASAVVVYGRLQNYFKFAKIHYVLQRKEIKSELLVLFLI